MSAPTAVPGAASRRRRSAAVGLGGVAILGAALLLAGCGGGGKKAASSSTATTTAPAATTTTTPTTAPTAVAGDPAQGKSLFLSLGCSSCHTFAAARSTGAIGPNLDTAPATDAKTTGTPLAAFIRESIVKPNAYISPGYPANVMPKTFAKALSSKQLDDLVAFLVEKRTGG